MAAHKPVRSNKVQSSERIEYHKGTLKHRGLSRVADSMMESVHSNIKCESSQSTHLVEHDKVHPFSGVNQTLKNQNAEKALDSSNAVFHFCRRSKNQIKFLANALCSGYMGGNCHVLFSEYQELVFSDLEIPFIDVHRAFDKHTPLISEREVGVAHVKIKNNQQKFEFESWACKQYLRYSNRDGPNYVHRCIKYSLPKGGEHVYFLIPRFSHLFKIFDYYSVVNSPAEVESWSALIYAMKWDSFQRTRGIGIEKDLSISHLLNEPSLGSPSLYDYEHLRLSKLKRLVNEGK